MPSPSSCIRCSRPLALLAPSGLCPECAATDDSAAPTPRVVLPPPSNSQAPTATAAHDAPAGTATFSGRAAGATASTPSVSSIPLPDAPAGYELLDRLGGGGMGDVYLAVEVASERLVAMKFVRYPGNPEAILRFTTELQVLAELDHPNIVRFMFPDVLRTEPYFLMEYLPGGSLSGRLKSDGPLAPDKAVELIRTIAGAVAFAHERAVIHRDLKPSNVLFAADGTAKVADFGLAKRLDEFDPITVASGALGTPSYMPPEQVSSAHGTLGAWSDVYGLGATLFHMLTGRAPFASGSTQEIVNQVVSEPAPRLRPLRDGIPARLEAIVLKCLEKQPKDRYQSVAEFLADLDRYEAKQNTVAPEMTRLRRAKLWARRHRVRLLVSFAALLLLAGAFKLGTTRGPDVQEQSPVDHWAVARAELADGRPATLIPAAGEPGRWKWVLGSAVFGPSPTGDGSCYFETVSRALLELIDDPGIDRYRIRMDLRQVGTPRPGESAVGVYFGRTTEVGPNGDTVHAFFRVSFHDYDPNEVKTGVVTPQAAKLERVLLVAGPQRPRVLEPSATFASCSFTPARGRPGKWYTVEIDVTPEEISARMGPADGLKPLIGAAPFKPVELYAVLQERLDDLRPPVVGVKIPKWSPRLPLGVSVDSSALTVRNVIIVPLPNPR